MKISLAFAGSLLLFVLPLRASSLTWENLEADLHPAITDKEAVAHFKYKNTGDQPVRITAVKPSCGCTTAAPPNEPVAPGASGEITATFHIGDRIGMQTKTIHVTTDEPGSNTTLTLKADVPKLLEINPTFLYWSKVQPVTPRVILAKVGGDFAVTKLEVSSSDSDVKVETSADPKDKTQFTITVTPKKTNRPLNAMLKIQPDFPKDTPKMFYANVRVDAHPENAPASSPAASPAATPAATP